MATAYGLNYQIPQAFIGGEQMGQPLQQQQVEQPSFAPPKDRIAEVEGLTNRYLEIAGQLESFATEMSRQGKDIFTPDLTQPGGGPLFQTAKQLEAALKYSANALANEQKRRDVALPGQIEGKILQLPTYDPTRLNQPFQEQFVATGLDTQVQQANDFLQKDYYTDADAARANAQVRDPLVAFYEDKIKRDPANRAYYERQIAGIGSAVKKLPYSAFLDRGEKADTHEINVLKRVTNLAQGAWPQGTYSAVSYKGRPMLENKAFAGEVYGQYTGQDAKGQPKTVNKVIKRWLQDPSTGVIQIEFEDPSIPAEIVSNKSGDAVTAILMSNNPKYGSVEKMYESARKFGLTDPTGSVINEGLVAPGAQQLRQQAAQTAQEAGGEVVKRRSTAKTRLDKLASPWLNAAKPRLKFTLPDGREVQVQKNKNGLYIVNWEDFFAEQQGTSGLSSEQLLDLVDDQFGYFGQFLNKGGAASSTQEQAPALSPTQQKAVEAFAKQFGRAPSAAELEKIKSKYK